MLERGSVANTLTFPRQDLIVIWSRQKETEFVIDSGRKREVWGPEAKGPRGEAGLLKKMFLVCWIWDAFESYTRAEFLKLHVIRSYWSCIIIFQHCHVRDTGSSMAPSCTEEVLVLGAGQWCIQLRKDSQCNGKMAASACPPQNGWLHKSWVTTTGECNGKMVAACTKWLPAQELSYCSLPRCFFSYWLLGQEMEQEGPPTPAYVSRVGGLMSIKGEWGGGTALFGISYALSVGSSRRWWQLDHTSRE